MPTAGQATLSTLAEFPDNYFLENLLVRHAAEYMADIRSFYFDTALLATSGLPSLLGIVDLDHIVFGTDYPYASDEVSRIVTGNLDTFGALRDDQKQQINRGAGVFLQRFR